MHILLRQKLTLESVELVQEHLLGRCGRCALGFLYSHFKVLHFIEMGRTGIRNDRITSLIGPLVYVAPSSRNEER